MEYSRESYDAAYSGNGDDFYVPSTKWLQQSRDMSEARWMLFSAQFEAAEWILKNKAKSVLDLGCGPGWFIAYLAKHGVDVRGAEIGSAPVSILRGRGFNVVQGSIEAIPSDWEPSIVTLFEVLEHLPDPIGFVSQLKARFPKATFILSVPSPTRWIKFGGHRDLADYPPNHLTRWNYQSLTRLLSQSGYSSIAVHDSKPIAIETASVSLRGAINTIRDKMPDTIPGSSSYELRPLHKEILVRQVKSIPGFFAASVFRLIGWSGMSIWAVAQP
jgi:SAM-dependent methyltransferase